VGLRASAVGQYLHIDITEVRLLDGSKAYVQAIIDNFSRAIVAHAVSATKTAVETAALISRARAVLAERASGAVIVTDDGSENIASNLDIAAAMDGAMSMVVVQVDILSSNSMIERFWLSMKHNWLFTQRLDSVVALRRFVDFLRR
jgi:transposase InsO family protein